MKAEVIIGTLFGLSVWTDHEGLDIFKDDTIVIAVENGEWESNTGNHFMETDLYPDLVTSRVDFFIVRPVVKAYVWCSKIRVKWFNKDAVPCPARQILEKIDGMDARYLGYSIPKILDRLIGLPKFEWFVSGGEKRVEVLYVEAPAPDREAAEWLADWLERKVPEYLSNQLEEEF